MRATFDGGSLTSDAGALVLAEIICFRTRMIAVGLIAAGYQGANDSDTPRADPVFGILVACKPAPDRLPDLCCSAATS